jgi:hypothetical protein
MVPRTPEEFWQAIKDDAPDLWFCPHPFEHPCNDNTGHWALCCHRLFPEYAGDFDHHRGTSWPDLWPEFKPGVRRAADGAEPAPPRAIPQPA